MPFTSFLLVIVCKEISLLLHSSALQRAATEKKQSCHNDGHIEKGYPIIMAKVSLSPDPKGEHIAFMTL